LPSPPKREVSRVIVYASTMTSSVANL